MKDFGDLDPGVHAGVVILYDDTMPAYEIASGVIAMVAAYPCRAAFAGYEELDPWV